MAVREVLRGAEERKLPEIAAVLAEAAESVARAVEAAWEAQPGAWMDSKHAARSDIGSEEHDTAYPFWRWYWPCTAYSRRILRSS